MSNSIKEITRTIQCIVNKDFQYVPLERVHDDIETTNQIKSNIDNPTDK